MSYKFYAAFVCALCCTLMAQPALAQDVGTPATDSKDQGNAANGDDQVFDVIKQEVGKPMLESNDHININHVKAGGKVDLNHNMSDSTAPTFGLSASEYTTEPERFEDIAQQAYDAVQMGHIEAGLALYKKALVMDPNNSYLLYSMATIYQKRGQFDQANSLYKQVLNLDPSNHKALTNYLSLLATTNPDNALRELKALESINSNFAPVVGQIGIIYAQQGQYNDAISYLQRAVALTPNEITYLYNLAVIYDKTGERRKARQLYYEVLRRSELYDLKLPISAHTIAARIESLSS